MLQGVEEVEVSLASIRNQNARTRAAAKAQSAATRRAFETADTLYRQGLTGLTERLTAETEWRQAELDLVDANEAAGVGVVRLYKALGAELADCDAEAVSHMVGIIDGVFQQARAVSPSELMDALRSGMRVYGSSSVGACGRWSSSGTA
ncbi:MAG: hypothetical protein HC788_09295 [Sphingopyxis sp.]|nr:hypothetical protein [Sphingopyxis sp.]